MSLGVKELVKFHKGRMEIIKAIYTKKYYDREGSTCKGDYWQVNHTPLSIVNKMIDKVEDIKNKSIFVMFNLEFLESLIYISKVARENITFLADNEVKKNMAEKVYGVNTLLLKKENHNVEGLKEIMTKKFDTVFSNPPYNANIDIKILKEVTPLAEELVIVHPSTWLIDRKFKSKLYNDFREQINGKLKSVEMFNGNPIFNIGLFVPTMITHIDDNYNGKCSVNYFGEEFNSDIMNITKFSKKWFNIVKPFMDKLKTDNSVWDYKQSIREEENGKYYCQLAGVRGHVNLNGSHNDMLKNDFYTMIMEDSDGNKGIRNSKVRKDGLLVWKFNSEIERDNFISYLKTDFARFCLAIYKNTQNNHYGEMSIIPHLDFTQEWNDEKLYEYFGIDEETQNYITNFLPDYHGIRGDK